MINHSLPCPVLFNPLFTHTHPYLPPTPYHLPRDRRQCGGAGAEAEEEAVRPGLPERA